MLSCSVRQVAQLSLRVSMHHSIPFLCVASPSKFNGFPSEDDMASCGGWKTTDGEYKFLNGLVAPSPSKACKLVLKRKPGTKTCDWIGPSHVFLLLNGEWKPLRDCDLTLEPNPESANLARVRTLYGKKLCLSL
jgi:hypothetical protein